MGLAIAMAMHDKTTHQKTLAPIWQQHQTSTSMTKL